MVISGYVYIIQVKGKLRAKYVRQVTRFSIPRVYYVSVDSAGVRGLSVSSPAETWFEPRIVFGPMTLTEYCRDYLCHDGVDKE